MANETPKETLEVNEELNRLYKILEQNNSKDIFNFQEFAQYTALLHTTPEKFLSYEQYSDHLNRLEGLIRIYYPPRSVA